MPKKRRQQADSTIFYLRGTSREVARKLKAAAALEGKSLTAYVQHLLEGHIKELDREGILAKGM